MYRILRSLDRAADCLLARTLQREHSTGTTITKDDGTALRVATNEFAFFAASGL
jgi:hypothetical protein